MTTDVHDSSLHPGYGRELFTAAAAAAERAPQLADEIRMHTAHLAGRFSSGQSMQTNDIGVRTLVRLIEQAGVLVPPPRA